ncbi:MAG: bifunctional precorrin-2 dehydrogenase/sirohydrochlorin ferrochelatase [Euryarchaeota archaeon]|nr:bifunctional precorrin-2 dehydrogenase/sirohydrochlorin ferrochelatase [Euryarchaeota archaeon]
MLKRTSCPQLSHLNNGELAFYGMAHVPLFIDIRDKCIVIFGGGHVGERKARVFCSYGPTKVISKSFTAELTKMAENGLVEAITDDVRNIKQYLDDAFIVVPATNNRKLNEFIADQAKTMRVLVNQVDGVGEVIVPSIVDKDDIRIGISTMGKSPASARFLRLKIEELIDTVALMVNLQNHVRSVLKAEIGDQHKRRRVLESIIADNEVWAGLSQSYETGLHLALNIVENERYK